MQNSWLVLTEVPGWPDAPALPRFRRALPILVPCAAMLVLLVWNFAIHSPRVRAESQVLEPLIALESEILALRTSSDQERAELAERTATAQRTLLDGENEPSAFLRTLKKEAADRGWEASFHASETSEEPAAEALLVAYVPVRVRMKPVTANTDPYGSLQALLGRFASSPKRIDLMRLAIRADEKRWQSVELNLRLIRSVSNAQAPQ
jgi:hypothetical protein